MCVCVIPPLIFISSVGLKLFCLDLLSHVVQLVILFAASECLAENRICFKGNIKVNDELGNMIFSIRITYNICIRTVRREEYKKCKSVVVIIHQAL